MKKTRLNMSMRDRLTGLADRTIQPKAELAALEEAYAVAEPLVREIVKQKFPPKDMEILKKYQKAFTDDCIKLRLADGDVEVFHFKPETGPLVASKTYNGQMYLADEEASRAVEKWVSARENYEAERKERLSAYRALIHQANNLEDLAEVWPEAATLFPPNLPMALGPEQVALVKRDVQERKGL